jgi:signal transduction histidine kinase
VHAFRLQLGYALGRKVTAKAPRHPSPGGAGGSRVVVDKTFDRHGNDEPGNTGRCVAHASRKISSLSLSTKLLILTIAFVMIAGALLLVPSIAKFRQHWLTGRLTDAQIASLSLEAAPGRKLPEVLRRELLRIARVHSVALRRADRRELVLQMSIPYEISAHYDLRESDWPTLITGAFDTLLSPPGRLIRVIGEPEMSDSNTLVEIVMDEAPLKAAMWSYMGNMLWLDALISVFAAILVYWTLRWFFVRPVSRLTCNMERFRENPEDSSRVILPSGRGDEIGRAERELAAMQSQLSGMLRQKSRLAALGLAVSKINHDLRNILANAQLISDRMAALPDPAVQRFAPKLIASLDRAIRLCAETLKFGKTSELAPERTLFPVGELVSECADGLGLTSHNRIGWRLNAEPELHIDADREQLFRVLTNLMRNAMQSLESLPVNGTRPEIVCAAWHERGAVVIEIADNGPGIPSSVRKRLFEPFNGSARDGGTGLGLAIGAEIARAHGGRLSLAGTGQGASFRLEIPDAAGRREEEEGRSAAYTSGDAAGSSRPSA